MTNWILEQSWGPSIMVSFFVLFSVFEFRRAVRASKNNKKTEFVWATFFGIVGAIGAVGILFLILG